MLEDNQNVIVTGSILHLAPITGNNSDGSPIIGAARDVGTIEVLNPTLNNTTVTLKDSRSGNKITVASRNVESSESYQITAANMSLENLKHVFGADSVQTYSQSSTALTNVVHTLFPDSVLHLHDNSGNFLYDIASVQSVGTFSAGVDFSTNTADLKLGFVKLLNTTNIASIGVTANVNFTPNAIAASYRLVYPQTNPSQRVLCWIYWPGDDADALLLRDHVEAEITPDTPQFNDSDFSKAKFTLTITANLSNLTRPAGRFLKPRGTLPPRTY
jgi:hypothetical protein